MLRNRDVASQYIHKFTWKEISDPIYDYVYFNREIEEKIINSLVLQRLRYILQLQTAHLVYPGAVHTRFQHSIGVMHLAGLMAEDAISKILVFYGKEYLEDYKPDSLIQAVRLAGLLHDAGHACFGHAFEEALLWGNKNIPEKVNNHEKIGYLIVEQLLEKKIREYEDTYGLDHLYNILMSILGPDEPREKILQLMRWLIKDSLYPADILDFLRRDSYYTGTSEYGYIDYNRLYKNTYPYFENGKALLLLDRNTWGEFRAYLYAKANMFEHVYYHSVNRAFDRLLKTILVELDPELGLTGKIIDVAKGDPYGYLLLTDSKLYNVMLDKAVNSTDKVGKLARRLLIDRKPEWKRVGREYILSGHRGPHAVKYILRFIFDREFKEVMAEKIKETVYDSLRDKGVDESDIWIDVLDISPVPRSTLIPGKSSGGQLLTLFIGKKKGSRIVKDRDVFLIEEGIPLMIIFRAYIRRGLHRLEYESIVTEAIRTTITTELGISDKEYKDILSEFYKSLKPQEYEKEKITV